MDEYKDEIQGLRSTLKRSLLEVNEDLKDKHNAENLCKRVKHKVYFNVLQRALPSFEHQVCFLVHLQLYVNNLLVLKELLAEVVADINNLAAVLELLCLGSHVAALEADDAVWQGIELLV